MLYRIVIPSVIFSAIEFLPKYLLRGQYFSVSDLLWETIGGRTYWFTSALVVAQLLFLLIFLTRCRNVWAYWIASLALLALGMWMRHDGRNFLGLSHDIWQFKQGLYAAPFLAAGGLYWKYEDICKKVMKNWVLAIMLLIYFAIFYFWHDSLRVLVSMLDVNWSGYIGGCFASVLLIEICRYLPKIQPITFIGQNSISFYFMSGGVPIVIGMAVNRLAGAPTLYGLLAVWVISLTLAYIITFFLNRYLPWIFDLRRYNIRFKCAVKE